MGRAGELGGGFGGLYIFIGERYISGRGFGLPVSGPQCRNSLNLPLFMALQDLSAIWLFQRPRAAGRLLLIGQELGVLVLIHCNKYKSMLRNNIIITIK